MPLPNRRIPKILTRSLSKKHLYEVTCVRILSKRFYELNASKYLPGITALEKFGLTTSNSFFSCIFEILIFNVLFKFQIIFCFYNFPQQMATFSTTWSNIITIL